VRRPSSGPIPARGLGCGEDASRHQVGNSDDLRDGIGYEPKALSHSRRSALGPATSEGRRSQLVRTEQAATRLGALAQPRFPLIPAPACGQVRTVALRSLTCKVSPSDCVHPSRRERHDRGGVFGGEGGIRPPSPRLRRDLIASATPSRRSSRRDRVQRGASEGGWRRGWDSNPRALSDKTLSRRPRYDHFGTSPQRPARPAGAGLAQGRTQGDGRPAPRNFLF
jgi:hypothetical protein